MESEENNLQLGDEERERFHYTERSCLRDDRDMNGTRQRGEISRRILEDRQRNLPELRVVLEKYEPHTPQQDKTASVDSDNKTSRSERILRDRSDIRRRIQYGNKENIAERDIVNNQLTARIERSIAASEKTARELERSEEEQQKGIRNKNGKGNRLAKAQYKESYPLRRSPRMLQRTTREQTKQSPDDSSASDSNNTSRFGRKRKAPVNYEVSSKYIFSQHDTN